jgi:16S rRNA (guanine1516-N2)-methyltransferase
MGVEKFTACSHRCFLPRVTRLLQIAVANTVVDLQHAAQSLAKQLVLPYTKISAREDFDFILLLTEKGLFLQHTKKRGLGSLHIDFLTGKIGYRLQHLREQKQLLAKAVGPKIHPKTYVLDLTAGLGNDGFVLAKLAYSLTLLERSAIIAALLKDGLQRVLNCKKYSHIDVRLIHVDATVYLNKIIQTKQFPNVIYLDPMYPQSNKSALAKKEMRFLRQIVGNDSDAESLLPLAMACAQQRVVVKRPRLTGHLGNVKPQHSIYGKQHRFDVYLTAPRNPAILQDIMQFKNC